jgi:hypothetical protein
MIGSDGLELRHQIAPSAAMTMNALSRSHGNQGLVPLAGATDATLSLMSLLSEAHFNSRVRSRAFCHLSVVFFSKQVFTTRSSAGGVIGWS